VDSADLIVEDDPKPDGRVSFPRISEEMINSLALGMEDDLIVASRHGVSVETFNELIKQTWFQRAVAVQRSEYEKNGVTFKQTAKWMAGELLPKLFTMAADNGASFTQVHETVKTLAKLGGLEPKEDKNVSSLPTFTIHIDTRDSSVSMAASGGKKPLTIDADTQDIG
jgi:hypothetical protein